MPVLQYGRGSRLKVRAWWLLLPACVLTLLIVAYREISAIKQYNRPPGGDPMMCQKQFAELSRYLFQYGCEHNGHFPEDLRALLNEGYFYNLEMLYCPSSTDSLGYAMTRPGAGEVLCSNPTSYVYLGRKATTQMSPRRIILYEPLENHGRSHVIWSDGSVEYLGKRDLGMHLAE